MLIVTALDKENCQAVYVLNPERQGPLEDGFRRPIEIAAATLNVGFGHYAECQDRLQIGVELGNPIADIPNVN